MSSPPSSLAIPQLTPRSKVAALLKDIDDRDSPSPTNSSLRRSNGMGNINKLASPRMNDRPSTAANIDTGRQPFLDGHPSRTLTENNSRIFDDDSSDEQDEPVHAPRGRAARRMLFAGADDIAPQEPSPGPLAEVTGDIYDDDLYGATPRKTARHASGSPTPHRYGSALFVSPSKSADAKDSGSDDELPSNPLQNKKLLALVAQKRAARLAREKDELEKTERNAALHQSSDLHEAAIESSPTPADIQAERILSDAARPTRKASKRALLEMERETQRLSRQMALAHGMKVKKKFGVADFMAKFQPKKAEPFREMAPPPQPEASVDHRSSSLTNSDSAERTMHSTPPSSPPTPLDQQKALVDRGALSKMTTASMERLNEMVKDEELPDMAVLMSSSKFRKARSSPPPPARPDPLRKITKLARLGKAAVRPSANDSDDDDLEVLPSLPPHLRALDRLKKPTTAKAGASKAIHNLKHLAAMGAYDAKPGRGRKQARQSVNPHVLDAQLRRQARLQAQQEREEKIAEMRAKGIVVQTEEERAREAEQFEDLLERARREAEALRNAERAEGKENGEISEDEDEDFEPSENGEGEEGREALENTEMIDALAEDDDDEEEVETSEEEETEELKVQSKGKEIQEECAQPLNSLYDAYEPSKLPDEEAAGHSPELVPAARKGRKSRLVIEEDSETESDLEHEDIANPSQNNIGADGDDPFGAFGFGAPNVAGIMSPTQMFKATMQTPTQAVATQDSDSFDLYRQLLPTRSELPPTMVGVETQAVETQAEETQVTDAILASQSQQVALDWLSQPPPETPTMTRNAASLIATPGWEPTQDAGFSYPRTPGRGPVRQSTDLESLLEASHDVETQETVRVRVSESPAPSSQSMPRKRRRLTRRTTASHESDKEDESLIKPLPAKEIDAFADMDRRRRLAMTAAEKAEVDTEMRRMLEEQAEESEDEYAGLGGPADDSHMIAPETEEDRRLIDDETKINVDERGLALYAERQRAEEEAAISKLYKDLTTGALRKRQGADWELDSDEDEAAVRRRQARQREEARKRRLLLQDDNLASLAQSKNKVGSEAFLKAIADDDEDDDVDLDLSGGEEDFVVAGPGTQSQSQSQSHSQQPVTEVLQETSGNKRTRFSADEHTSQHLPANKWRAFRRPASLDDIRDSVSFLLDEPNAPTDEPMELSSDDEGASPHKVAAPNEESDEDDKLAVEEARQNHGGFAPNPAAFERMAMPPPRLPASQRRTVAEPGVVDRLSLKRASSTSTGAGGPSAWTSNKPGSGGVKAPSLLRRATTSTGQNDAYAKPSMSRESGSGLAGNAAAVKKGGSSRSSLQYAAREAERRAIVDAASRKREEGRAKIAAMRRTCGALANGLTGQFE